MMTDLLTLHQAAHTTRFSVWTLRHWITQGRLQAYKPHGQRHWLTTIESIILAADNNFTDKQRKANIIASQLMREFGLERVDRFLDKL